MFPIKMDLDYFGEVWKEIPSRPSFLASNYGRIKLPNRTAPMPSGGIRHYITKPTIGTITRPNKGSAHLYRSIYNRTYGNLKVHQLICETFVGPKPFKPLS